MQTMTLTKTAIALVTIAVASAPHAVALQQDAPTGSTLKRLIDPAPPGTRQADAKPSTAEIKKVLLEMLLLNEGERVGVFGESAGPALRELVNEGSLEQLTRLSGSNPLHLLVRYAPLEALAFFSEAQRGPSFRYEALIRSPYSLEFIMQLHGATGESRALIIDVLDRTLASPTLDIDTKLRLAIAAHGAGLASAGVLQLIRDNAEYASTGGRNWSSKIYDVVVPAGTVPPVDLPEQLARKLIDERPSIEVLDSLSQSPHARVRSKVGEAIRNVWENGLLPRDRTVVILTRLATDEDPDVVFWATEAVGKLLSNQGMSLAIEDVTMLVAGLANRPTDSGNLAQNLAQAIHRSATRAADEDAAKVEALYRTAFASQMTPLHEQLRSTSLTYRGMPLSSAVAYFRATDTLPRSNRLAAADVVAHGVNRLDPWSTARAAVMLEVLGSDNGGVDLDAYIVDKTSEDHHIDRTHNDRPGRGAIFRGLPPDHVPDALQWLTSPDVDVKDQYAIALASVSLWPEAGPQLRSIMNSSTASTRARVLAGAGLTWCTDASTGDMATFASYLGECLADPDRRGEVELYYETRNTVTTLRHTPLWNDISLSLLRDARVPDEFAVLLPLLGVAESSEQVATFDAALDAAERRMQADSTLDFKNMSYFALEAMAQGRTEVRPALLRSWILGDHYPNSDGITVVLEMEGNADWIALVLDDLLKRLRYTSSVVTARRVVDQILRLPGDEAMQQLLEYTMRSDSADLVKYVDDAVANRLRIREASVRWSSFASGGADVDTAKIKVIRLLESSDVAVKVAAIRGLGTLGAVEALPQLIELVGSDEPTVRDAALETLELLNRQAAARAPQPANGTDGGK